MSTEDLHALLDLQAVDTSIDQHRHRRQNLPERASLAEIDGRIAAARQELAASRAVCDEIEARQAAVESELAATELRSREVSKRLYGGEVSASRELQAMSDELDSLKGRASGLEDQLLEILEEREPVDSQVATHEAALSQMGDEREGRVSTLASAESAVDADLEVLDRSRQEAVSRVPESLLAEYERLRTRLGGIAVARLVNNRCDGCHLTLAATELDRIRHLPPGELVTCDQCGRILVPGG